MRLNDYREEAKRKTVKQQVPKSYDLHVREGAAEATGPQMELGAKNKRRNDHRTTAPLCQPAVRLSGAPERHIPPSDHSKTHVQHQLTLPATLGAGLARMGTIAAAQVVVKATLFVNKDFSDVESCTRKQGPAPGTECLAGRRVPSTARPARPLPTEGRGGAVRRC